MPTRWYRRDLTMLSELAYISRKRYFIVAKEWHQSGQRSLSSLSRTSAVKKSKTEKRGASSAKRRVFDICEFGAQKRHTFQWPLQVPQATRKLQYGTSPSLLIEA